VVGFSFDAKSFKTTAITIRRLGDTVKNSPIANYTAAELLFFIRKIIYHQHPT